MKDEKSIEDWCKELRLNNYTINHIDGTVNCIRAKILGYEYQKIPIKFGNIADNFYWSFGNLISLEGSPTKVGSDFFCYNNSLTSLEGCPKKVGNDFDCQNNKLISLEGCPMKVGGLFYCGNNPVYKEYSKYDNYKHYMRSIKLKKLCILEL